MERGWNTRGRVGIDGCSAEKTACLRERKTKRRKQNHSPVEVGPLEDGGDGGEESGASFGSSSSIRGFFRENLLPLRKPPRAFLAYPSLFDILNKPRPIRTNGQEHATRKHICNGV